MLDRLKTIQYQLTQIKARQARDRMELETLEKEVKLARGTRDVKQTKAVKVVLTTQQLTDAVVRLTKEGAMTLQELSTALNSEPQAVSNVITALKKQGHKLINVGEPRRAKWYYVPLYRK